MFRICTYKEHNSTIFYRYYYQQNTQHARVWRPSRTICTSHFTPHSTCFYRVVAVAYDMNFWVGGWVINPLKKERKKTNIIILKCFWMRGLLRFRSYGQIQSLYTCILYKIQVLYIVEVGTKRSKQRCHHSWNEHLSPCICDAYLQCGKATQSNVILAYI